MGWWWGKSFYIANSGWDAMDEKGNVKVGATVSSNRIMRAAL